MPSGAAGSTGDELVRPETLGPTALERQQINVAATPTATFWHRTRFDLVVRRIHRTGAERLLDVGAGSGMLGDHLAGSGVEYRFSEPSPRLRGALIERFGSQAELVAPTRIMSGTLVTLLDVIEHVDDDRSLLAELHDRMEAGVELVITVPAMTWLFSSWDRDLGHHRRYSRRDCCEVVSVAGFDVVESGYLFPELVPLALLRKLRRSDGVAADFPLLPNWVDRIGQAISTATTTLRRVWPIGTSVVVVARPRWSPS
jgi:hypothetical protein